MQNPSCFFPCKKKMLLSLHIQEHTSLCLFPSSPLSNGKETQCRRGGFRTLTAFHQAGTLGSSIPRVYKSRFQMPDSVHTTGVEDIQEEAGLPRWPLGMAPPSSPQPLLTASRGRQESQGTGVLLGGRWSSLGSTLAHSTASIS